MNASINKEELIKSTNSAALEHATEYINAIQWLYSDDLKHGDLSHMEFTLEMLDLFEAYQKNVESANKNGVAVLPWETYVNTTREHFKTGTIDLEYEYNNYSHRATQTGKSPISFEDYMKDFQKLSVMLSYNRYKDEQQKNHIEALSYDDWTRLHVDREHTTYTDMQVPADELDLAAKEDPDVEIDM